jgi:gamma-glutamyltranspeptidase/glutathione hydrolase
MLNILEGYDLRKMGFGSADYIHHFLEAKKLAFEDRAVYYADPAFSKLPTEKLMDKDYAAQRRSLIDPLKAKTDYKAGNIEVSNNTIYLTVADSEGNIVSLIQSNFAGMGSGIIPEGLGFSLQKQG